MFRYGKNYEKSAKFSVKLQVWLHYVDNFPKLLIKISMLC